MPLGDWLEQQSPGRRLWLLLGAIGVALGLLSLLGGQPGPSAEVVASASQPASVSASTRLPVTAEVKSGAAALADTVGSSTEQPGAAGKPVKTITIARTPKPDATSSSPTSAPPASAPPVSAPALETAAKQMNIKEIRSPGGISAWLVEEQSVPLLALRFVFDGGSSQDPAGKEGLASFITAMMDEGAGDLDASQFQERMEELALRMNFEATRDAFYGNFETLTANRDPSLDMLRMALTKPRFDADATERIRKQILANLAYAAKNPQQVAGKVWYENAFAGHPYGRHTSGSAETVGAITAADLEAFRVRTFARDTLRVVAVGDITAEQLGTILDKVFGDLPAKADLTPVSATTPKATEKLKIVEMDVPQSVVQFGMPGLARKDPDFIPAFVMNQILGGGGFASRLTEEVREKRGLAYSVYSYLQPYRHAATFSGGVATKNEAVKDSIDVIRAELARMAADGPTETELANAKSYLTGSFALRFDTNAKIASQLLWMLHEDMGIDYVSKRNASIDAVTMEDVKRAAARVLKIDDLSITVVGKPKGLRNG
jgi:zinc protease